MGKILIMLAPGTNSGEPKAILLSALVIQGSLTDSTSYPYIVFIVMATDNLYCDNQQTGETSYSMFHTSCCGIRSPLGSEVVHRALREPSVI